MTDRVLKEVYNELSSTADLRRVPRFGHTNRFAAVFGSQESAQDYISGLLFAGLLVFSLFFVWSVALLILKCFRKRTVGFLAGGSFDKPRNATSRCNRPFICRVIFVNATILFILFSVLFVTQGLTELRTTVDQMVMSAQNVDHVMTEVDGILTNIGNVALDTKNASVLLLRALAKGGQECLEQEVALTNPGNLTNFQELINTIKTILTEFGNFTPSRLDELQNSTEFFATSASNITDEGENIEVGDWQSLVIIIPFIIIPSTLLVGVCLAWFQIDVPVFRSLLSYLVLPVFIVQTVFAYSFSSGILIVAAGNADFCSGGTQQTPDETVMEIIAEYGYTEQDLVVQIASWYVGQCVSSDPFSFMDDFKQEIVGAKDYIANFTQNLEGVATTAINQTCASDAVELSGLSKFINNNLLALAEVTQRALNLLSCEEISKLYTDPVYVGTCNYSIRGFTWTFAAFMAVAMSGMVMIMLRSSWQLDVEPVVNFNPEINDDYQKEFQDETNEYGGYTGYDEGVATMEQAKDAVEVGETNGDPDARKIPEFAVTTGYENSTQVNHVQGSNTNVEFDPFENQNTSTIEDDKKSFPENVTL